ncbi:hypothetical protein REPUB_Repub15cG0063600 [Reevesia pubescens]
MEFPKPSSFLVLALVIALTTLILPVYGQINTPCSSTMLSTFTPCMNFLTNSSGNGTSPSEDCCNSLKTLTSGGMDCVCLIVERFLGTLGVPKNEKDGYYSPHGVYTGCTPEFFLIVIGNVPFRIPINRTLAISFPQACNMPGVPVQCKATTGVPVPTLGPISLAPILSPGASPTLSPKGFVVPKPIPSVRYQNPTPH